jgi:DNA (cytosine-5)-methyltransferase 1
MARPNVGNILKASTQEIVEQSSFRFVDVFAGLGGFHYGLEAIGGECVFASEIEEELRELYCQNHGISNFHVHGDIANCKDLIPEHELLAAGFPCQPFSKSGKQMGFDDADRGGCIFHVLEILKSHRPQCFIFENVGNLSRHNQGKTWKTIKERLKGLGYCVRSTADPLALGESERHLSPHLYGYPQRRERFFAVGSLSYLPRNPFPIPTGIQPSLQDIIMHQGRKDGGLTRDELNDTKIGDQAMLAIELWNIFVSNLPHKQKSIQGSFPLWLEEYKATYPYATQSPYAKLIGDGQSEKEVRRELEKLPPYARERRATFPLWKIKFIDHNREWLAKHDDYIDPANVEAIRKLDYTYRKLEWNWKASTSPNIWAHTVQLRPSGIRISNPNYIPTIVSLNASQRPIYGRYKRHLTVKEISRAFGFPDEMMLPTGAAAATKALGNAVHADVVRLVATRLLSYSGVTTESRKRPGQQAA